MHAGWASWRTERQVIGRALRYGMGTGCCLMSCVVLVCGKTVDGAVASMTVTTYGTWGLF